MSRRVLQVIECAQRASLVERDDSVVWLTHAMKTAGADLHVLLRGNAVRYAVKEEEEAKLAQDVCRLVDEGVPVKVVEEDLRERGFDRAALMNGLEVVSRASVPKLFSFYDRIWHW